jgi:phage tail protein X
MQYATKYGDMLDAICHEYYSGRPGATELVLNANPGLADLGPVYPVGIIIELPELPVVESKSTVTMWS